MSRCFLAGKDKLFCGRLARNSFAGMVYSLNLQPLWAVK
jgi:hypothetical protein